MNEPMQMSPHGDSDYEHESERGGWRVFYTIAGWAGFIFLLPLIIGSMKMHLPERGQTERQAHD